MKMSAYVLLKINRHINVKLLTIIITITNQLLNDKNIYKYIYNWLTANSLLDLPPLFKPFQKQSQTPRETQRYVLTLILLRWQKGKKELHTYRVIKHQV